MRGRLRVATAGCGSAGPAAACLLAEQGHEVTIFERAPREEVVGAGFLLQPTGQAVLKAIGVWDQLEPKIAEIDHLFCRTLSGRALLDLRYDELEPGLKGAGTHRATFLRVLLDRAARVGVNLRWGCPFESFLQEDNEGVKVTGSGGEDYGCFDALLVCDGARSKLRKQMTVRQREVIYPWEA